MDILSLIPTIEKSCSSYFVEERLVSLKESFHFYSLANYCCYEFLTIELWPRTEHAVGRTLVALQYVLLFSGWLLLYYMLIWTVWFGVMLCFLMVAACWWFLELKLLVFLRNLTWVGIYLPILCRYCTLYHTIFIKVLQMSNFILFIIVYILFSSIKNSLWI